MAKAVTVDFNANLARFTSTVDKAINDLNRFKTNASRTGEDLKKIFEGLGVGIGVTEFKEFVKGSIDAADKMNDLSKSTGIAVEKIAGLDLAARQSGGDLESIALSINKLSQNIGGAGSKFAKLGIDAKDPLEAFKQLADVFNSIQDPQLRAKFAAEALGKSWAGAAPLLAEGSSKIQEMVDKGTRLSKITKENAELADKFDDKLEELKTTTGSWGLEIGITLIPMLTDFANRLDKITSSGNSMAGRVSTWIDLLTAIPYDAAAKVLGKPSLAELDDPNLQTPQLAIGKIRKATSPAIDASNAAKQNQINKNVCEFNGGVWDGKRCNEKPTGPKDDPTKRLLENRLKGFEAQISKESDLLASRNRFTELYNTQNLLSIEQYYSAKTVSQQESLTHSLAAYDQEIAALEKFKKKANKVDTAEAQGKINDILDKKSKLQQTASEQSAANNLEQARAIEEYKRSLLDLDAQIFELTGHLKGAAAIRFDQQNKSLSDRLRAEDNKAAQEKLQNLRSLTLAQAEVNGLDEKASQIQDDLTNKEQRIDLARKLGSISEIGALRAVDEARAQSIDQLKTLVDNYEQVAIASGNPKLLQNADNLKLKLEELVASSHQLADKFSKIFEDSASTAFEDFINGSKNAGDAFAAFADDVVKQINKIVAQNIAQSLFGNFGGGGLFGSLGGFLGGLFGGISGGGNASPGVVLPKFAEGTDFVPRDMVALIHKGEKITPAKFNNNKSGGINAPITFILSSTPDHRTQQQIANQAYNGIMRAVRRNG